MFDLRRKSSRISQGLFFGTAKLSRRCTAWYGKPAFCTLLYAGFVYQPPIQRQILHSAVKYSTVRTSKMVFENGIKNSRTECTACTAILKSGSHFLARQRIDHLNAHKSPHPLTAGMDIVGGLHVVKPLILCKLRADAVGGHGFGSVGCKPTVSFGCFSMLHILLFFADGSESNLCNLC